MNFFEEQALRLKQELGLSHDKDVAALLGLSPRAWAGRKERGIFPTTELLALMAKRPDLAIDFDYVTLGIHSQVFESSIKQAAQRPLTTLDEKMAGVYAKLPADSRKALLDMATQIAQMQKIINDLTEGELNV